ncbi:MAG: 3-dehydroquinate synthase [Candidatus Binataceae bacterium]|jgi:3-dehydroquinate synthase
MRSFRVELGANAHAVHVGASALDRLGELAAAAGLGGVRSAIITDENVGRLYLERARRSLGAAGFDPIEIVLPAGESSKSIPILERVYDRMVAARLDRKSVVFALGGGVIGDLAGFAAATFLRGLPLVQVPTTVVAQVDSALGGKTAINHRAGKNLIGSFYQPRMIVADVATLGSLPEREFREGLAEVIKYGAIMDEAMFAELERDMARILARDSGCLDQMIYRSLRHKASVVERDEREGGLRAILNFGHTVGHALEAAAGYGEYLHGEAVAIGMVFAARLSSIHAGLPAGDAKRIEALLSAAGLPIAMPADGRTETFVEALELDKKRAGKGIEFVLLDRLGHALTRRLSLEQIMAGFA